MVAATRSLQARTAGRYPKEVEMSQSLRILLAVIGLSAPAVASAQDTDDSGRQIKYKERTEIDFEGVDVNGELVKPAGQLLLDRRKANFNPLIRIRENFSEEMKQSIDEVK
jgi:hypothetical protein